MTRIATKGKCNLIEAGGMYSGSFLGELISECPTYQEIKEIGKFNVTGTYENDQLVKESDITKYTGKTINYANVWGEWDLTNDFSIAPLPVTTNQVILKFHITFLYNPDVPVNVSINYTVYYMDDETLMAYTPLNSSATIKITNPTFLSGVYGGSVHTYCNFGTTKSIFGKVSINSVTVTPISANTTSIYEYQTFIKPVTQNYLQELNLKTSYFNTKNYIDNTTEKKEQCTNKIEVTFQYPTNITSDRVSINIEPERNFNGMGSSGEIYYDNSYDFISYEFTTPDNYGERGYKLPYYTAKFKVATLLPNGDESYYVYLYPIWNPREYNTGIELISLIDESEPISEE